MPAVQRRQSGSRSSPEKVIRPLRRSPDAKPVGEYLADLVQPRGALPFEEFSYVFAASLEASRGNIVA